MVTGVVKTKGLGELLVSGYRKVLLLLAQGEADGGPTSRPTARRPYITG